MFRVIAFDDRGAVTHTFTDRDDAVWACRFLLTHGLAFRARIEDAS